MKATKFIPKLAFLLILGFLVFSSLSGVQAPADKLNKYERWIAKNELSEEQYIYPWVTISSSEKSWFRPGISQTEEMKDAGLHFRPYDVRVFIDGVEIKTQKLSFNDKDGEFLGDGIPRKWMFFTHIFEPGYFAPGEYSLRYEFYWYDIVDGVKIQRSWLPEGSLFWVEEGEPIISEKLNKYEKWVEKNGLAEEQYIYPWVTISSSEKSWFRPGIGQTQDDKEAGLYFQPYDVQIFIDGVEIKTQRFVFNDKDGEFLGDGIPTKWVFFTYIFEPGYFELGEHTLKYEFYWCDMVDGVKVPQSWLPDESLFWVD